MVPEKFVVRFLDAEERLLGWAEVYAEPRPQDRGASCPLFAVPPVTPFAVEQAGTIVKLSVHWCALDIARVREFPPTSVQPGQIYQFAWFEPVWLVAGMRDVPLPAVTVREPQTIDAWPGVLGARG